MAKVEHEYVGDTNILDDLLLFRLPLDQLPGQDKFSKAVLKQSTVIDLVTSELLGVPPGTYITADTDWGDGCRSDVVYIPRLGIQKTLPPILVEIQATVNESFMQRMIRYCQNVLQVHDSYPLALVICIDKVTPSTLIEKFQYADDTKPWLSSLQSCDFWAKSCSLVSKSTLSRVDPDCDDLMPLQALSSFLIEQSPTLHGHSHPNNPIIRQLYTLAMKAVKSQHEHESDFGDVIDILCSNNQRLLEKASASLIGVSGTSKARHLIHRAIEFNTSVKRKYELVDSDSSLEPVPTLTFGQKSNNSSGNNNNNNNNNNSNNNSKKETNMEFIMEFKKNLIGRMNWNRCLKTGHEQNLLHGFRNAESLRSFYNRNRTK
ncbi:hypothetical protein BCR42DRAFT_416209 [Absidia repens]|uniref:Uncharacterized protein n=1 Tax=Absidia repens TaxID=90262 RepID=A0A1X2IGI5_9FUNG|nr:hypothetical protein BCR42DRAFT_416209 [Absidia repens]